MSGSSVEDRVPDASPLSALIGGILPIFMVSGPLPQALYEACEPRFNGMRSNPKHDRFP
jgi:hypothetical protein